MLLIYTIEDIRANLAQPLSHINPQCMKIIKISYLPAYNRYGKNKNHALQMSKLSIVLHTSGMFLPGSALTSLNSALVTVLKKGLVCLMRITTLQAAVLL